MYEIPVNTSYMYAVPNYKQLSLGIGLPPLMSIKHSFIYLSESENDGPYSACVNKTILFHLHTM